MSSDAQKNPTRSRILQTACDLLAAGSAVRMSDIAKAAGISRQALYLHFPNRAELLIAAARYLDEISDIDARLAESRAASDGPTRLDAWIRAWGGYIPVVRGLSRALVAMKDSDEEAAAAWNDRMDAMRQGCAAAVSALAASGVLRSDLSQERATDLLWSLLSIACWAHLVEDCGWSQEDYLAEMHRQARAALMA